MSNKTTQKLIDYLRSIHSANPKKDADMVLTNLGAEDFISLTIALDDEDEGTISVLIDKAKQNEETDISVEEAFEHKGFQTIKIHETWDTNTVSAWLKRKNINHVMGIGRFVHVDSAQTNVSKVLETISNPYIIKEKKNMKKDRPIKESVLGMTKVNGLNRIRKLAGLSEDDEVFGDNFMSSEETNAPALAPASDYEFEPSVATTPPSEAETTPILPALDDTFSDEYKNAVASLDSISRMVMNMKISEFKLFMDRVDTFHKKVQDVGHQFMDNI